MSDPAKYPKNLRRGAVPGRGPIPTKPPRTTASDPAFLRERLIARLPTGRESATSAAVLAGELGISTREVGAVVADLIENDQWLIGSTCNEPAGYFIIRDLADLEAGTAHIVARAKRSFVRVAALRRAARERFSEAEVLHLFDLEDVS